LKKNFKFLFSQNNFYLKFNKIPISSEFNPLFIPPFLFIKGKGATEIPKRKRASFAKRGNCSSPIEDQNSRISLN